MDGNLNGKFNQSMDANLTPFPVFYTVSVRYCSKKNLQFSAGLTATGVHEASVHLISSLCSVYY